MSSQHGLATIAKARGLDGADLEDAADGVDDQCGQRFAFHIFSHDEQRTTGLGDLFQQRQQVANVGDLFFVQQDVRIIQCRALAVLLVDEVRRQVAAVELHAFDDFQFVLQARTVFDGDHAFLADLLHRIGNDLADDWHRRWRKSHRPGRFPCVVAHGLDIFFSSSTVAITALSIPRLRSIGLTPAATYFKPSLTIAWANTVAVVVPSPATSEVLEATSLTICAPMFSNLSFSSISLATDTPSLVMVGAP